MLKEDRKGIENQGLLAKAESGFGFLVRAES
jgi:hypothetical protein